MEHTLGQENGAGEFFEKGSQTRLWQSEIFRHLEELLRSEGKHFKETEQFLGRHMVERTFHSLPVTGVKNIYEKMVCDKSLLCHAK